MVGTSFVSLPFPPPFVTKCVEENLKEVKEHAVPCLCTCVEIKNGGKVVGWEWWCVIENWAGILPEVDRRGGFDIGGCEGSLVMIVVIMWFHCMVQDTLHSRANWTHEVSSDRKQANDDTTKCGCCRSDTFCCEDLSRSPCVMALCCGRLGEVLLELEQRGIYHTNMETS
jgi:hypothetical protein